jgi:hypothetical protein
VKSSIGIQNGSKSRIQGLARSEGRTQVSEPVRAPLRRRHGIPFTLLELVVLAAGFGALAAMMTSCSSTSKRSGIKDGSEPISTGLARLSDPKSKQPKLNKPAEISKDSEYQKLADQAKVDYEALFNRDPKKAAAKTASTAGPAKSALKDLDPGKSEPLIAMPELEPAPAPKKESAKEGPVETVVATPLKKEDAASITSAPNPQATVVETKVIPQVQTVPPPIPIFKGANALLAARVTGFGKYVPLATRPSTGNFVFQSARSNRAIVYIEIENFGYRAVKEGDPDKMSGDQWAVDLTTEMQLLDAFDGMLQMKEAERSVIETGRNKRKDFYLVQEIELPPTLTIGSYNLKIVLRDKSGAEPIRTETIIPIQIVADLTAVLDEK